jgi:hypothetical protein
LKWFSSTQNSEKELWIRPGGMGDLVLLTLVASRLGRLHSGQLWVIQRRSEVWAKYLGLNYVCLESLGILFWIKSLGSYKKVFNFEQFFGLSSFFAYLLVHREGSMSVYSSNRLTPYLKASNRDLSQLIEVPYSAVGEHETMSFARMIQTGDETPAVFLDFSTPRLFPQSLGGVVWISGRQSDSRRIPLSLWKKLIDFYLKNENFEIHFDEIDSEFAEELSLLFPNSKLMREMDFSMRVDRLKRASILLTVDSGVVHIASFFGVPVIAFFSSGDEKKWSPLAKDSKVLVRSDLSCHPCNRFGQVPKCVYQYECWNLPL